MLLIPPKITYNNYYVWNACFTLGEIECLKCFLKEQWTVEKFKSQGGAFVHEFCDHGTRADCRRNNPQRQPCRKVCDFWNGKLLIIFLLYFYNLICL